MNRKKHVAIWIGILSLVFILAIYGQVEQTEIPQGAGEAALLYGGALDPEELALSALRKAGTSGTRINFYQWRLVLAISVAAGDRSRQSRIWTGCCTTLQLLR